jgi:protein CpxP
MRATYSVLAFATALALASAAQAQSPPAGPGPWMRHAPSPEMQARREAHEQQRIADLRTVLRLRPDQEAALAAFLKSHGGPPEGPMHDEPMAPPEAMTTPQHLDQMARWQARRAAEAQRRTDALKAFYAALSPEQQKVFDAVMRLREAHGPGGHQAPGMGGPGREHHPGGPGMEPGHPPE